MTVRTRQSSKTAKKSAKARLVERTKLKQQGWNTTDEDEIALRRIRGETEKFRVENKETAYRYFSSFLVASLSGSAYHVEIRSLQVPINSCDCPDYRTNSLGTCKHIEHVLFRLKKTGKRNFQQAAITGSSRIEIYVDCRNEKKLCMALTNKMSASKAGQLLQVFFSTDGTLLADPTVAYPAIQRIITETKPSIKNQVRLSHHIDEFSEEKQRILQKKIAKKTFLADLKQGKRTADIVKFPLYPYQTEGMMHLAFTERALLADEMGLGKTVQAVAACELLRRLNSIQRVLVIATASLKTEWEEQIAKFTALSSMIIQGPRAERLKQYQQPAFFYLTNYEQILMDGPDIQRLLAPDVIILDEAQRIKNWQTKTANAVKILKSRYAFVLTGTPLENKIDDIYSVVQFLYPTLFGSLFRFNRDFYQLDDKGKPTGYKNLDELHRRLRPVMLRRRKGDVEGELPERTVNTFFVKMDEEQRKRYEEYQTRVAKLVTQAQRRPLRKEEFEKLQKWLSCMRMLCDTPYILDQECRISPKLRELENILEEILEDDTAKIIIFSEWERMLQLVRELASKMKINFAWHTGTVPQHKRRDEINRFKNNADCRLFLSTDSGSVGLNLQSANVVINLDLPWNPAKLEQRIARAWRKHQTRTVQVIHLVTEDSIEHRMLGLLSQKQALANTVLEGLDNIKEMELPSGRAAFMERMESLLGASLEKENQHTVTEVMVTIEPTTEADPIQRLHSEILARFPEQIELLQVHQNEATGRQTILAVIEQPTSPMTNQVQETLQALLPNAQSSLELLDRNTFEIMQRLATAGIITINQQVQTLHSSETFTETRKQLQEKQITEAKKHLTHAERKQRLAGVLIGSEFKEEAVAPLREAIEATFYSFSWLMKGELLDISYSYVKEHLIDQHGLPSKALSLYSYFKDEADRINHENITALFVDSQEVFQYVDEALNKMALG